MNKPTPTHLAERIVYPLRLEVAPSIADDIRDRIIAVITDADAENERLSMALSLYELTDKIVGSEMDSANRDRDEARDSERRAVNALETIRAARRREVAELEALRAMETAARAFSAEQGHWHDNGAMEPHSQKHADLIDALDAIRKGTS